jgi:hypothetical protein
MTTEETIRSLRIVYGSLIGGILVVLGIARVVEGGVAGRESLVTPPLLLGLLAVVTVLSGAAYTIVGRATTARLAATRLDSQRVEYSAHAVLDAYRNLAIIRGGLIDGPSFLAAAVYLLTGSGMALAASGLGVALLLWSMPSRERLERFAEQVRER